MIIYYNSSNPDKFVIAVGIVSILLLDKDLKYIYII